MFNPNIPAPVLQKTRSVQTDVGTIWLPAGDQVLLPYMAETGLWEPSEAALLRTLLTPTTRFLDVGAHVGYFSLLAAEVSVRGTLDAVEPDPNNYALLQMNLWQYAPRVRTWGVALGRDRALVPLTSEVHNSGNTCVAANATHAAALTAIVPGDELFGSRRFDLIKIDVQGQESEVLLGMQKILRRSPRVTIVAEFFPDAIVGRGVEPREVLQLYRALGFHWVASVDNKLLPMDDEQLLNLCTRAGQESYVNLLLTRLAVGKVG